MKHIFRCRRTTSKSNISATRNALPKSVTTLLSTTLSGTAPCVIRLYLLYNSIAIIDSNSKGSPRVVMKPLLVFSGTLLRAATKYQYSTKPILCINARKVLQDTCASVVPCLKMCQLQQRQRGRVKPVSKTSTDSIDTLYLK